MGFQTQVNVQPAPAVEGDFASANPRFTVLAGPGGLVAGPSGVTVGRFCWLSSQFMDPNSAATVVNNFGSGTVAGFVHREQQGLITTFLAESSMLVPVGFPVTVFSGGDFWVRNVGAAQALVGQKAYANFINGSVTFAATGAPTNSGTSSASTVAIATAFNGTGSITGNVLTITATSAGVLPPGATISGTGVATGTQIVSQLSGTPGGVGTYALSIGEQTVASTAITGNYGLLTIGGSITGTFSVGDTITGTNVPAGTFISANNSNISGSFTGTGGAGTYAVTASTTVASTAINAQLNVETKWIAMSEGLTNELVKISDHALG